MENSIGMFVDIVEFVKKLVGVFYVWGGKRENLLTCGWGMMIDAWEIFAFRDVGWLLSETI